eukprot:scaffold302477_cov31-Tisochrysis_lutea.AAC.1
MQTITRRGPAELVTLAACSPLNVEQTKASSFFTSYAYYQGVIAKLYAAMHCYTSPAAVRVEG